MDIHKLDTDFRSGLGQIKTFIPILKTQSDINFCQQWISRLILCSPQERVLRNFHLVELCRQAEKSTLGFPFNRPPPDGPLQPLQSATESQDGTEGEESSSWKTWKGSEEIESDLTSSEKLSCRRDDVTSTTSTRGESAAELAEGAVSPRRGGRCRRPSSAGERARLPSSSKHLARRKMQQAIFPVQTPFKDSYTQLRTSILWAKKNGEKASIDCLEGGDTFSKLQDKITELTEQNKNLVQEIEQLKGSEIANIKQQDISNLKNKLQTIEETKYLLEKEHRNMAREMDVSLDLLQSKLKDTESRTEVLLSVMSKVSMELEKKEVSTEKKLVRIQHELDNRLKAFEMKWETKFSEIEKEHFKMVQNFENEIVELKNEILRKCSQITKLEHNLQEQSAQIRAEVDSVRNEAEREIREKNFMMNAKVASYRERISRLLKTNLKTKHYYETRIKTENRIKQMELWMQKLNVGSTLTNCKQIELEKTINELEDKFSKQLANFMEQAVDNATKGGVELQVSMKTIKEIYTKLYTVIDKKD